MREMKDSGTLWIGEIPKEWEIQKAKWVFKERNEKGNSIVLQLLSPSQKYGVIPQSELDSVVKVKEDTDLSTFKTIHAGDYCISLRSFQGGFEYSTYEGVVSPAYHVFYANGEICDSYYKFLFKCVGFIEKIASLPLTLRDGKNISFDMFGNMLIPMPPLCDQQIISTYLDTKCTKIDSIIEKQEKIIEKLKAYKLSVITEAVTKGLNPDVKMKDSGVEFLGEVPENWEVIKFGRCITIKSNLVPPENYYDYPQIAPDSIEKNSARLLDYKTVMESGVISWNHLFFKGQIIYSKIRPLLNKVIIAPFDGLCSADMYPIETENNSKFIVYVILSKYFSAQVGLLTENRVKMPKINQNELSGIIVAIPKLEEQQQIADYLDKKCSAIDKSIGQKQSIIEKLKEYKKSLIYEVVTGKKEV